MYVAEFEDFVGLEREVWPVEVVGYVRSDIEPKSKARPRMSTKGGKFRTYTPKTTLDYEEYIRELFKANNPNLYVDDLSAYGVSAVFYCSTNAKKDVDNMLKAVVDSLNGVVWDDDNQVTEMSARKVRVDKGQQGVLLVIYETTSRFGTATKRCEKCNEKFEVYPSTRGRKFCSQECSRGKAAQEKECPVCGTMFKIKPSQQYRKSCSNKCSKWLRTVERDCLVCGETVVSPKSLASRSNPLCEGECYAKFWRERRAKNARGVCADCGGPTSKKTYTRCQPCAREARR